jgi:basic amino acid/polyamine antiporter, APA family
MRFESATTDTTSSPTFLRAVGVLGLAAAIFNCTVGGGIFRLPSGAAAAAGSAAPFVYLICAAVIGCVVLCFAEVGSRVAQTGGPYAYVEAAYGRYPGFLAGVLLWMIGTTAVGGVGSAFAEGVAALAGVPAIRAPVIVGTFVLLATVNMRGIEHGTRLVMIASVAKLLPLLVFVGVGIFFIQPGNLVVGAAPPASDMARAAMILFFAFMGVETALVPSGEVRDPARAVPRALALAMIGVTALYLCIHVVAAGLLGPRLATATIAPLAFAAERFLGRPGYVLLLIGASISMFGYLSGMTLAAPRALWKFADEGFLPKSLAAIHVRFRTPHVAIIMQSLLVTALAVFNSFEQLAVLANVSALLLYGAVAVATLVLRRRDVRHDGATPFRVPGGPLVPVLTVALIGWLLSSITQTEWAAVGATLAVASCFYAVRSRLVAHEAPPHRDLHGNVVQVDASGRPL